METVTPNRHARRAEEAIVRQASRFANPAATVPVPLGPCRCPDESHADGDSAVMRAEIGDGELRSAATRGGFSGGPTFDGAKSDDECIATFTLSWTLLDDAGEPVPITAAMASLLDEETRAALLGQVQRSSTTNRRALPNGSGGPSRASSRVTASQSRAKPKR